MGIFLLLLGLVLWNQRRSGAFVDEFGGHPDEAGHFVSSLMIQDYVKQLPGEDSERLVHPKRFAEKFHEHYPKVAIGNWPPGFHLLHAVWMLVFPPGQGSVFILMALLSAALAQMIFLSARSHAGKGWALAAALLFVVLPIVQKYSSLMMTEMLMGLLVFSAVLTYARFLETNSWRWSLGFSVLASAAILVKGSGLALGLMPPLAVLLLRRWSLLKTAAFWIPAAVVGLLCTPWYVYTLDIAKGGWEEDSPSLHFFLKASRYVVTKLMETGGPVILLMVFLGLAKSCFARKGPRNGPGNDDKEKSCFFPVLAILLLSVPIFHCIIPAGKEHRHLIPMLPAFVIFAVMGMRELCEKLSREDTFFNQRRARWVLGLLGLAGMFLMGKPFYSKGFSGFRPIVTELYKVEDWSGPILISSDASGEGMFVAEAALADRYRVSRKVHRASKVLGDSRWSGAGYKTRYEDEAGLRELLKKGRYWAIVVDESVSKARPDKYKAHMRDLENLCRELQYAERHPLVRGGKKHDGGIVLYRNPMFAVGELPSPEAADLPAGEADTPEKKTIEDDVPPAETAEEEKVEGDTPPAESPEEDKAPGPNPVKD